MGNEGGRGVKDEAKDACLHDMRILSANRVRVQSEGGLGGNTKSLVLAMLSYDIERGFCFDFPLFVSQDVLVATVHVW